MLVVHARVALMESKGRLLTLPTNIRLLWKPLAVTNTLAYCFNDVFTIYYHKLSVLHARAQTLMDSKGRLLTLPSNIRLLWERLAERNTLDYCDI